jgi:hypothetical protein
VSKTIDDARQLIESRLAEIEAEVNQLRRALPHLVEGDGPGPRRRSTGPKATASSRGGRRKASRRKGGRRAARGQRRDELLAAVGASPGARPSELAAQIGIRPGQASVLIAKARTEKLIVKSGQGYALKS